MCFGIVNPMRRGDDDTEQIPKMQEAARSAGVRAAECYRVLPADPMEAHGPSMVLNAESTRAESACNADGEMQQVLLQRELK